MIKLQDILSENLDIEGLFNKLITKIKQSGQSTAGLEKEFGAANDPVAKLKVLNKYKNIVKEEMDITFKIDPTLAAKIYDILEKEGISTGMTKSYFTFFLNDRL
jgi:hypothetical protein